MVATLFVGCLPYRFSGPDVVKLFDGLCEVVSIEFFEDWEGARFSAHAQVQINADDVSAVVAALDGRWVQDSPLMVHVLVEREDHRVFLERQTS